MVKPHNTRFRSPYEERLELVKNTLTTYSALDDDAASKLPVHVLHALNSIPREGALSSTALTRHLPRPSTRGMQEALRHIKFH